MDHDIDKETPETPLNDSSKSELTLPVVSHQSVSLRRLIQLAYWVVVVICLPIWWSMTSIERLSLPASRVAAQQKALQDLTSQIDIVIHSGKYEDDLLVARHVAAVLDDERLSSSTAWHGMGVNVITDGSKARAADVYHVYLHNGDSAQTHEVQGRDLHFYTTGGTIQATSEELAKLLSQLINPATLHAKDNRIIQYAPNIRLSFSLLSEDYRDTGHRGWAAERGINEIISPTLQLLSPLHNFTIESQVQPYAPLAFDPLVRQRNVGTYYALGENELKIFINSPEWTLSSKITNDPVLHLILFSPANRHRPLLILDEATDSPSDSPAFIIPQWGGIVLFNPGFIQSPQTAPEIFSLFRTQLLTLLEVPPLPPNVQISADPDGSKEPLSLWQIDALLRRRIRENMEGSIQALSSIIKLVDQLKNMPVGMDVKGEVLQAIEELEKMHASDVPLSALELFTRSKHALAYSSKAFFNPGMVGQLYFPAEHKYAIYMLFAPASMPLIVTLVRELKMYFKRQETKKVE